MLQLFPLTPSRRFSKHTLVRGDVQVERSSFLGAERFLAQLCVRGGGCWRCEYTETLNKHAFYRKQHAGAQREE